MIWSQDRKIRKTPNDSEMQERMRTKSTVNSQTVTISSQSHSQQPTNAQNTNHWAIGWTSLGAPAKKPSATAATLKKSEPQSQGPNPLEATSSVTWTGCEPMRQRSSCTPPLWLRKCYKLKSGVMSVTFQSTKTTWNQSCLWCICFATLPSHSQWLVSMEWWWQAVKTQKIFNAGHLGMRVTRGCSCVNVLNLLTCSRNLPVRPPWLSHGHLCYWCGWYLMHIVQKP